jgi:hypothetical protein
MLESAVGTPVGLSLESRSEADTQPRGAAIIPVETNVRLGSHGDDGDASTRQAGIPLEGGVNSPPEARSGRPLGIRVPKAGSQVTGRTLVAQAEKKADTQAPAQTRFAVGCPESPRTPVRERVAGSSGRTGGATTRWAAENEKAEPVSEKPFAAECGMSEPRPLHGRAEMPPMPGDRGMPERAVPITARAVVDQIVRRAEIRLGRSEAEMVIDLKPDVLGRVHLRITAEPGRIVAQIRAENSITRQLIEAGLGDLKVALAERGLDLGSVTISGGFGAGIAWDGSRSRWAEGGAGRGESGAAQGGERADSLRAVGQFAVARPFHGAAHIVDCVA